MKIHCDISRRIFFAEVVAFELISFITNTVVKVFNNSHHILVLHLQICTDVNIFMSIAVKLTIGSCV